jgi:nicotinamide mononucleotide transporter
MQLNEYLELTGSSFSIIYSLLLMKEKKWGWWFGIASSIIGVYLFYKSNTYGQALISLYYAGVGMYGFWYWSKAEKRDEHINRWKFNYHIYAIVLFGLISVLTGLLLQKYTSSTNTYLDAFVTIFGLLASLKEARKILSSWVYWFLINAASVLLYYQQGLTYYAWMMVIYTLICIPGYLNWLRIYKKHATVEQPAP